jgi:uncharacterized repeat protein (TIGR01451 family)
VESRQFKLLQVLDCNSQPRWFDDLLNVIKPQCADLSITYQLVRAYFDVESGHCGLSSRSREKNSKGDLRANSASRSWKKGAPVRVQYKWFLATILCLSLCLGLRADQSVSLAWDQSPDTNVVGYAVYYGNSSGAYDSRLDVGTNTTATVRLAGGLTYFFVATSYDAEGLESEASNEVSYSVPGVADLSIIIIVTPAVVNAGSNVTYSIQVTNAGPDAADNVTVSNLCPSGLSFVVADSSQGAVWKNNGLLIFELGPILSGGQAALSIVATAISPGPVTNSVNVATTTSEFNLRDNVASASLSVLGTNSAPLFSSVTQMGGTLLFTLNITMGQQYQLQYKTALNQTNWNDLGSSMTATNTSMSISDIVGADPQRFYRVVLLP